MRNSTYQDATTFLVSSSSRGAGRDFPKVMLPQSSIFARTPNNIRVAYFNLRNKHAKVTKAKPSHLSLTKCDQIYTHKTESALHVLTFHFDARRVFKYKLFSPYTGIKAKILLKPYLTASFFTLLVWH